MVSSEEHWNEDLRAEALEKQEHAIQILKTQAENFDISTLFPAIFAHLALYFAQRSDENEGELAGVMLEWFAYYTFPHFGQGKRREVNLQHIEQCLEALHDLNTARFQTLISDHKYRDRKYDDLLSSLKIEADIVRGSAFPEQTSEEINEVQGHFDRHFSELTGISPKRAVEVMLAVIEVEKEKFNAGLELAIKEAQEYEERWKALRRKKPIERSKEEHEYYSFLKSKEGAYHYGFGKSLLSFSPDLPVSSSDLTGLDPAPSDEEWSALIDLIGFTPKVRATMIEPVEAARRPMFVLPGERVVILDISNVLDALWDGFEHVARQDDSFFSGRYAKVKAKWLESKVEESFARVFPKSTIYKSLQYPDPNKSGGTTELDLAVAWGPFLILVEAKAKQFKVESRSGDIVKLRRDIKANVEDAFYQAKRALTYIGSVDKPVFLENETKRKLTVDKESVHRIYLITISQHYLAGLANQFALLEPLELFKENEYPISMSIGSLELITEVCEAPDVFLHYLERRITLQKTHPQIRADELDLFGAYLDSRLQEDRFKNDDGVNEYDIISIGGYLSDFDLLMRKKRGDEGAQPDLKLSVPEEISEILNVLRHDSSNDARGIAFFLLGLSDRGLRIIADAVSKLRTSRKRLGAPFQKAVGVEDDTVIFLLGSVNQSREKLDRQLRIRTDVEKYRFRAEKAIGIGVMLPYPDKPITSISWREYNWRYDEEVENAINDGESSSLVSFPAEGVRMPGRNAPCPCGSGKKYKHCHLRKV